MVVLSKHFEQRWRERVGTEPSPSVIQEIIDDPKTVRIQACRDLQRPCGGWFRQAAVYWSPALDVIVKIDEYRNRAITVLSKDMRGKT
jgi:hypothetical protein